MTLRTLRDVRELFRHLPDGHKDRETWQHVARTVSEAALGRVETEHVLAALWLVFQMEGVECETR
jgi:hypothetical protein